MDGARPRLEDPGLDWRSQASIDGARHGVLVQAWCTGPGMVYWSRHTGPGILFLVPRDCTPLGPPLPFRHGPALPASTRLGLHAAVSSDECVLTFSGFPFTIYEIHLRPF